MKKYKFFNILKKRLSKTRKFFSSDLDTLFKSKKFIDDDVLEKLEELLITSDLGVDITLDVIKKISKNRSNIHNSEDVKNFLRLELLEYLNVKKINHVSSKKPSVIMVVGVNGVGKTTTIGKLAYLEFNKGNKVLIAAADTFRAAAVEQVKVYAELSNSDIVLHKPMSDPAAVVYDSITAAVSRKVDKVLIDTAGRSHTNINLMKELKKIDKSIAKKLGHNFYEIFLVIDATTGQNAISQSKKFFDFLNLTGLILTKLDGLSKGGVVFNICRKFKVPVKYVGTGEQIKDLYEFDSVKFVNAIL